MNLLQVLVSPFLPLINYFLILSDNLRDLLNKFHEYVRLPVNPVMTWEASAGACRRSPSRADAQMNRVWGGSEIRDIPDLHVGRFQAFSSQCQTLTAALEPQSFFSVQHLCLGWRVSLISSGCCFVQIPPAPNTSLQKIINILGER